MTEHIRAMPEKRPRAEGTEDEDVAIDEKLDWSDKQRRILTADGKAAECYTAENGYPYKESELPHYWLSQGKEKLWKTFSGWRDMILSRDERAMDSVQNANSKSRIVGAWKRPLFYGGWEHSTSETEHVFNVQTSTLFVDLRLPVKRLSRPNVGNLHDLTAQELRLYARQHCFAGFSWIQEPTNTPKGFTQVCARHHCIDWNYVGTPRNRPNKWWIEIHPNETVWKEWAFAKDESGQHYYCERWEALSAPQKDKMVLALYQPDMGGVIVVVGNHFNFCFDRPMRGITNTPSSSSLVDLVDQLVEQGDQDQARQWLSLEGGHGTVSSGWIVDAAVQFWKEGKPLWSKTSAQWNRASDDQSTNDPTMWWKDCSLHWEGQKWQIFECNLTSLAQLQQVWASSFQNACDKS